MFFWRYITRMLAVITLNVVGKHQYPRGFAVFFFLCSCKKVRTCPPAYTPALPSTGGVGRWAQSARLKNRFDLWITFWQLASSKQERGAWECLPRRSRAARPYTGAVKHGVTTPERGNHHKDCERQYGSQLGRSV